MSESSPQPKQEDPIVIKAKIESVLQEAQFSKALAVVAKLRREVDTMEISHPFGPEERRKQLLRLLKKLEADIEFSRAQLGTLISDIDKSRAKE